ncbi:MAG: signal peptidase II [Flavobacteriaceae bacterium]
MLTSKRSISVYLFILFNIVLDQISKFLVRKYVNPNDQIELIGDYFLMLNVENTGAFLGMGSDFNPILKQILLIAMPVLVLGYLIIYILKNTNLDLLSTFALAAIAGGGIANIYDRIRFGSVTDFLFIDLGGVFKTGIFNIADVSVSTGMIILLIMTFKSNKKASL